MAENGIYGQNGVNLYGAQPDYAPDSLYDSYMRSQYAARPQDSGVAPTAPVSPSLYADGNPLVPPFARSADPYTLDTDPFGDRTVDWGRRAGQDYRSDYVASLSVFGRAMSRDQLMQTDAGRRLLDLEEKKRNGHKRGFLDAITDFQWSDLPFIGLFASVGGSISDAVTVSDTMKKLQNGEAVSDEDLVKTRLYMAENEYRSDGSWGSTVGDIIRAAPGFMAEFLVSGGALSLARTGITKAAGAGIHLGMTRSAKILAREATQHLAEEATAKSVGKLGAKAFADLASDGTKDRVVAKVSEQLFGFMKRTSADLYKGMSDDAIREIAENRAKYEFSEMLARNAGGAMSNGFNKFGQWLKGNISRGVMDFGGWGTEESTVLFTGHTKAGRALADAVGTFLVEAPVKGAMLMAPNQLVARPLVAAVAGQDGRVVSDAQLSLQQSALMTDNKSLMDNAEAIAFGINMLEYVSENAGRGFGSLLSAGGLGLEKVGVKGLVRPASKAVTATGGLLAEAGDEAVTIGGRMRKFVTDVFGTREQYAEKMAKDRLNIVAGKLGVTDAADRAALGAALLSNSTDALRPELRTAIGGDVAKFAEAAMDEAYRSGRRDLEYKTYARYAVAKWMHKHQVGPETVMNLYEQMGYDGILGEMFEERYSDVAKGLLGLDDRAEHDFFSNLKEAVKGLYPGWDQLTAEAVGFAMPMVTRMGIMRLQSAIGGEGKVREIRTYLEGIDDAMRHDTSVQMSYGQYLATHRLLARRDAKEISVLNGRLAEARKAKDTELEAQLSSEIETLTKVSQRRDERHRKFIGSLSEQAKENADAIVTVPLLSNATLADDEKYARTPAINSDQAAQGLAGQTAIVDFAPELARRIYEAEMPLEGETDSWYRKAAHRIVGLAGALVTGDFSLAATNPAHWTARDMGLSDNVLNALKAGFKETYAATRNDAVAGRLGPRAEIARLEKEIAHLESTGADAAKLEADRASLEALRESAKGTAYEASAKEVMDEAQRRFAARARQIMSANLAAHQLRSFSDGRVRDQAIAHVAATYSEEGDDRPYNYSVAEDGSVSFYKLASDGKSVDEATVVSADDFYARNKQAVDRAHDRIVAATVSLLTRGLTASDDSRRRLLASVRMKADSELLDASIYSAAMHLIGQENLVHRVRIDGRTPLAEVMRGHSIGRTNMAVVDYIAGKASADEVDARAFESIAHSIGFRFDGTEKGLADRNAKIFRMAKLATMLRREGVEHFSKAVLDDETEDRLSANGVTTVTARRNADGSSYTATLGLKADGSADERTFASRDELVAEMRKLGYSADTARIVFTQAKVVESEDMFHMIRELGLARQYASLFGDRGGKWIHPMLRRGSDGKYLSPERAAEVLRAEMAAAAAGRNAEKGSKERSAYERLWGENGYMAVGERLLELNGVKRNSVSKYAGEFSDYTPTLYTLSLNAGRISARSADVYVPVDPSVDEDVTSGVVNALLMHAYAFNGRLLKNELKGPVSDFLHQLDAVIGTHLDAAHKAKDEELAASLLGLRRLCTADIDRVVKGDDGKLRVQRGYGLSAQSFTTIASAFCLYRDRAYADNPFLRAVADVAADVRRAPAFADFLNLVDLTLGGNGFLSEAARNAVRGEDDAGAQRGVRALMTWASGDPSAFRRAVRESLPGGMSYTRFLDLCTRRLSAMSKSGAPVISDKEKADLSDLAQAAEADAEQTRLSHFTFLGNLIGTVKGILDSGKVPRQSFVEFLRGVASDAAADPNNTEEQRSAITSLLGMLQRTAAADEQTAEYEAAIVRAQTAEEKRAEAEARLADVNRRLVELERAGRGSDAATQDELAAARAAVTGAEAERQAAVETLTSLSTPETLRRADVKGGRTGVTGTLVEEESDEDAPADSDPDLTVGSADMNLDVPEAFAAVFGAETGAFTMRKGHVLAEDEDHLLTRSQARLACNIAVRSVVATGGSVTETEVAGRLRELFPALVASETEDVLTAFRTADDLRMRAGKEWSQFAVAGAKWDFGDDTKSDEDVSSDDFNDRSLAEYNSEAVEDFLALAQRSTPETGRNLQGFLRLTKETARAMSADDASAKFLRDVLNPKLDERATTQALASAFLLNTLDAFDTPAAGEHVRGLLAKRDGQPVSRRGAFLLSYLCALPTNARTKFGLLCANSVAATPVHLDQSTGILGNAHRKSGGKVPESLVVDGFHRLVGASPAEAGDLAAKVLAAEKRLLSSGTSGGLAENARAVADEIAAVFGRESPLYSALTSEMARRQWSALPKSVRDKLAEAVTGTEVSKGSGKRIRVLSTIASALKVLASYDGTLTRADVASVFTAAFAVGDPSSAGLREAPRTAAVTDPLMTFLSSFQDALPETIMTAEIDQRRESKGSSVAVAPRDLVPMLSRWLYADEATVTTVVVDGEERRLLSFSEACRRFFPGVSDETIRECRQDGTWPDAKRTPICAKCISTSYNTNEIYRACKAAYDDPKAECYWIPIYAGDHASSTLLQIPRDISFADVTEPGGTASAEVDYAAAVAKTPDKARAKDRAKMEMSNAFIGFGVPGSSTARYADAYGRAGLANTGDYGPKTVAFVSVNGSRGQGADGESAEQVRTYAEAVYAIARGATLVTDGFEYAASTPYNVGERRLREILALLGAKSEQVKTSGGTATRWTMDAAARKRLLDDPAGAIASAAYHKVSVGDTEFAGLPVLWHSAAEMAKLGFRSFAGLKDGVIHASADMAKEKFAAKAWENPERSKAVEGFTDRVRDVGDLLQFAFLHELAHTFGRWHRGEAGTAHEDWANGWALRRMDSYREVKGVPKPERPDFAAIADPSERALAVAAFQEAMADWMEASHRGDADTVRTERVPAPNRIPAGVLGNLTGQRTAPARTGKARRPTYQANAKAACEAVGLSLMFTDTKRSAVSSLEAEGVGMVGVEETVAEDGTPSIRTGENRVHIIRNWKDPTGRNEAFLGSTFMRGYGAKALKRMAQDPRSSTLKAHVISTYGSDLFFAKSLSVATEPGAGEFLEGTSGRAVMDYLAKYRGSDELSTDLLTDFDSYKIGPAASKALKVRVDGREEKVMEAVFDRLYSSLVEKGAIPAKLDVSTPEGEEALAKAMKAEYGSKLTGDALDALFGDLEVVDKVRGDRTAKLSELLPGATVNFVEGVNGPTLDLSYREDGAMAYTVANVSHRSTVPAEPGASPRNYEVDALTMASVLDRGGWLNGNDRLARGVWDLVANWGLVANTVYSDPAFAKSLIRSSESIQELIRNGEDPDGQNVRQELARQLWARIRQESNLPLAGVDMPLVSCGASIGPDGSTVFTHATSRMQQAMMKGSELFSEEESRFYGTARRLALCNVNVNSKGFRYGWFLKRDAFDASDFMKECAALARADLGKDAQVSDGRLVALTLAKAFTRLRDDSDAARGKKADSAEAKRVADDRAAICAVFVDHHGLPVSDDKRLVQQFGFADLFVSGGSSATDDFDLSAVQCEGLDLVHNDATGEDHVFLGGTMFGLPRTPSYNGSMWLQTVRAGLPVTERQVTFTDETGAEKTAFRPGIDAMVSPDPFTNAILGCDHDGDKTKVYMLTVNKFGRTDFASPPSASTGTLGDGTEVFDAGSFIANAERPDDGTGQRDHYLNRLVAKETRKAATIGFLENCWFNEETGEEEKLPINDRRDGHYFRIPDTAKQKVSNQFVRHLFNMARCLPTGRAVDNGNSFSVEPRFSEGAGSPRVKFIGGVASSPTKAFPVSDENRNLLTGEKGRKHVYQEGGNIGAPVLADDGSLGTIGDPEKGADVSTRAADAADARAMAVSMARTLHLAWATGYFREGSRNLFGGATPEQWLRFMYHVDGLSNATFDDIKEQICGRLGWTKDMMDTVVTELLVNASAGGKLPTTDLEFATALGAYSKDVKDRGAAYWMLHAANQADDETGFALRAAFGAGNKQKVMTAFGIESRETEDGKTVYSTKAPHDGTTVMQAVLHGLVSAKLPADVSSARFLGLVQAEVASKSMRNPVAGRLYHVMLSLGFKDGRATLTKAQAEDVVARIAKTGEAFRFAQWASKRSVLLGARSFGQSVNYLTADPGDPAAASRADRVASDYASMKEFLETEGRPTSVGGAPMASYLERMHAATRLAYDIGAGLETIAARAVGAAIRRRDVLFPAACRRAASAAENAVLARALVRDSVPQWDRLRLEGNAQQVPYVCGFLGAFGSLASRVNGTRVATAKDMYRAVKAMADGVGASLGTAGASLEFRHGLESMFSVMYELMTTSSEFNSRGGNKAAAYLRCANDTAYGVQRVPFSRTAKAAKARKAAQESGRTLVMPANDPLVNVRPYGPAGDGLRRIVPLFRANDQESVDRIRSMFAAVIDGTSYSGSRRVQGAEGATVCKTFSLSTKSLFRYAMELAGVRGKDIGKASRENLLKALDSYFGTDEAVASLKAAESKLRPENRRDDGQLADAARRSNDRYRTVLDAYAAAEALEAAFGEDFEMTPAMMFGQFLPFYSLTTSRTLGAPTPTSPSLLNLLPKEFYAEVSAQATALDRSHRELMSVLVGTNWAPVNAERAAIAGYAGTLAKKADAGEVAGRVEAAVAGEASASQPLGDAIDAIRSDARGGDADVSEARTNPDYRNTLDGLSDGILGDIVDWLDGVGQTVPPSEVPPQDGPGNPAPTDPKVAKVAAAMGSLLGSWATVEYDGGTVFTIRGRLRGDAGHGKEVVITVDASGSGLCDTPEQVKAYANSFGYAQSLCAAVFLGTVKDPVTGEERRFSAEDFMRLPLSAREGLVRRYGIGGATLNKVAWTADGRGLATLVGAIRLTGDAGTKAYHEYFHAMMRMFEQIGLLGEADYEALVKQFGRDPTGRGKFNEERAAEAFRAWVEGNTDRAAKDVRSVFRRIFDFLRGFFEALCNGFNYTGEANDDTIFRMMVHGFAQPSDARKAELASGNAALASAMEARDAARVSGEVRKSFRLPAHDVAADEAGLVKEAADALSAELSPVRRTVSEVEDAPGFESLTDAGERSESARLEKRLARMLEADAHTPQEDLNAVLSQMAAVRQSLAYDAGQQASGETESAPWLTVADPDVAALERLEAAGNRITATGRERTEVPPPVPGTPEAVEAETREQVTRTVFPQVEANDFYRIPDFIATALENELTERGSWRQPLESVIRKYAAPTWASASEEALDRKAVLNGLRKALVALNPEAAKRLDDKALRSSLVFEAALRMYGGLERSLVRQTGERGSTGKPMPAGDGNESAVHASMFQVSAWIVSTRPLAPAHIAQSARDRIAELYAASRSGASKAELKLHLDMMDRLLDTVGDVTKLMEFRYDQGMMAMNEIIGRLKAGTKRPSFDEGGFMDDIAPIDVADPNAELTPDNIGTRNPWSAEHLASFLMSHGDPAVQESLKLALTTAYQVAAMAKFYQELDVVPASAEDLVMRNQMLRRHRLPPNVTVAEWMASQAIGDSDLVASRGLVDHADQPYFIANNVDAWLSSLVRKSFGARGNIGDMLMAENHEYGALKTRIADLENFYSMVFGTNVEDGGEILKVLEHTGEFRMEDGAVVRKVGGRYVKFDNYNRVTCRGVTMTESDLRVVDLYLKMCSAHASNQSSVITGVDRLHFDRSMSRDKAFYSRDAVLSRYNDGQPSTQMNALEIALVRMTKQLPSEVLDSGDGKLGLYDRFVDACLAALDAADSDAEGTDASATGSAVYNSLVISRLVRAGLVEGMCPNGERYEPNGLRKYTRAVLKLGCDELNDLFLSSSAYAKLRANGRTAEMLDRDRVCDEFMGVYRDAARFVRQHPWLTHGDGQYFNGFGTALPFWRGSGVFMYNAVRSLRDRSEEEIRNLPRNEQTVLNLLSSEHADTRLPELPDGRYQGSLELLAGRYGVGMTGRPLVDAIAAGRFERGTDLSERTGLVLPADATLADVAKAIYDSYLNEVWRIQSGEPSAKGSLREAERILEVFEASRMTRGEMFGGSTGINDEQMFRQTGTLPANYQIGHKVHVAIDGLTNAMMSRATMANLLMTPAYDGAPVYYADPSRFAADTSGLPDDFWKQVARWWSEYNSAVLGDRGYDPAKSGVQNAHDIYEALMAERSRTKGSISYRNADGKTVRRVKYRELAKDDGDIVSVDRWLVREDDRSGEESSMLNALGGGEAMGYLKQFVQAGRTLGFGGAATRASLHRILSWSKSMSVSFSFFFPLATRWESPIGTVGAMATMASNSKLMGKWAKANPELFAGIQRMFGGDGWITKDFLGFQDILEMMDSNDPFLAEMKSWANALGITLSTSLVNPVEPTKSVMAGDIAKLKEMLRDKFGAKVAAKFGRIMETVALRQGDRAFNYALNATKLACVAQLAMKLRYEAAKRGKAFDPVRDLRRYSGYINAEIGGIDPLRYAWAHPMNRGIMNALMFSWQWTRGTWEAGGGNVLEDMLFGGHSATRQEREYYFGRWCRMFGGVMIGVPMMFQAAVLGMSKALRAGFGLPPDDDEDNKWWTFQNEDKTRWTAFDITPLLKAISALDDTKLGGMLRRVKTQGGPVAGAAGAVLGSALGAKAGGNWVTGLVGGAIGAGAGSMVPSFIPEYTGTDAANQTSRGRRYYMHFGKQGWEFFRWFDDAKGQFFSKLSMPTQRLLEGVMGRSLGYLDRSLAWEDMGQFERWLAPTTDSALFNLAEAFLPFSVGGINRNADAGVLPIFGPVQMGASQTALQKRLVKELTAWAHNDRTAYAWGVQRESKGQTVVHDRVNDILADAKANGFDPADQLNKALGQVLTSEYGRLFRALPDDPDGDFDVREVNRIARALNRLGARKSSVLKSIKTRFERQRRDWKTLPPEYRETISSGVRRSLADPFTEPADDTAQGKGFDY